MTLSDVEGHSVCGVRAAVYLCKRTMQNKQRLELADYEAENLARLQKTFSRKWEFIFMQAEAQAKLVTSPRCSFVDILHNYIKG